MTTVRVPLDGKLWILKKNHEVERTDLSRSRRFCNFSEFPFQKWAITLWSDGTRTCYCVVLNSTVFRREILKWNTECGTKSLCNGRKLRREPVTTVHVSLDGKLWILKKNPQVERTDLSRSGRFCNFSEFPFQKCAITLRSDGTRTCYCVVLSSTVYRQRAINPCKIPTVTSYLHHRKFF